MLPIQQSDDQDLMLLQHSWSRELNPLLAIALTQGHIVQGVALSIGATTFNHFLGRQLQGWFIVDKNAASNIYRSEAMNATTLTLTSDAIVTANVFVF